MPARERAECLLGRSSRPLDCSFYVLDRLPDRVSLLTTTSSTSSRRGGTAYQAPNPHTLVQVRGKTERINRAGADGARHGVGGFLERIVAPNVLFGRGRLARRQYRGGICV